MANKARVHVELRQVVRDPNNEDRDIAFKRLFTAFKKACSEAGVMHAYRQHEAFESKSRKRRRKKREAELALLKTKLKENFPQGKTQGKPKKKGKEYAK